MSNIQNSNNEKIYDKYISSYIDSMRNDICKIRTMNN